MCVAGTAVVPKSELWQHASGLVKGGLKSNTHRTYDSAQKRYLDFCELYGVVPWPADEDTLLLYVAYLHKEGIKGTSIRVYLAAVRSLHVMKGLDPPYDGYYRLKLAIKCVMGECPPKEKLPITLDIMQKMLTVVNDSFDDIMFWAAATLAHFGMLRVSEFTVSSLGGCSTTGMIPQDITFHNDCDGVYMLVIIRRSKTDVQNRGVQLCIGCTGLSVCAHCAVFRYLARRRSCGFSVEQPLFLFRNGTGLTRSLFVKRTRLCLSLVGINDQAYSSHSYRVGGATTAAAAGLADWEIKLMGRWSSEAYLRYIKTPMTVRAGFARRMCLPSPLSQIFTSRSPYYFKVT